MAVALAALSVLLFFGAPIVAIALCVSAGDSDRAIEQMRPEPREEGCEDYGSELDGLSREEAFSRLGWASGEALAGARGRASRGSA